MNMPEIDNSVFKRLRFVLVETSSPGNIGAAARAIKTMGFGELVLVNPRFPGVVQEEAALAFASGAQDVLADARIVTSIREALQDCNFAAAVSARLREFSPPLVTPRVVAAQIANDAGLRAALIFGNERFGLPNELVQQCNALINIPANLDYSSLNLAQAVQVLAYECRMAELGDRKPEQRVTGFRGDMAGVAEIAGMFRHLEEALAAIEFLEPDRPGKLMPRLKRLFARTRLETEEINILRGIARQILTLKQERKPKR